MGGSDPDWPIRPDGIHSATDPRSCLSGSDASDDLIAMRPGDHSVFYGLGRRNDRSPKTGYRLPVKIALRYFFEPDEIAWS